MSSCDKREIKLKGSSDPELLLTDLNGRIITSDSIKLSLKSARKEGAYNLTLKGGSEQKDLTALSISGSGTLKIGAYPAGYTRLPNGTYRVTWKPSAPGESLLRFTMVDENKNIREALMEVGTFDNLPPIANLQTKKIDQIAASEYLIDGSASYDRDARFGGYIASYEFTIGDKKMVTEKSSIKYIFDASGLYELKLKVTDGDGASHTVSSTLEVKL